MTGSRGSGPEDRNRTSYRMSGEPYRSGSAARVEIPSANVRYAETHPTVAAIIAAILEGGSMVNLLSHGQHGLSCLCRTADRAKASACRDTLSTQNARRRSGSGRCEQPRDGAFVGHARAISTRLMRASVVRWSACRKGNAHGLESAHETVLEEANGPVETGDCPSQDSRRAEKPDQEAPLRQSSRLEQPSTRRSGSLPQIQPTRREAGSFRPSFEPLSCEGTMQCDVDRPPANEGAPASA